HRDVQDELTSPAQKARQTVSVAVAEEEHGLKEHHAGVPDRRASAEERQERFGDDRLNEEEERGGEEDGRGEEEAHAARRILRDFRDSENAGGKSVIRTRS